jgi:PAS domain S-box-containing protein
MTYFRNLNLFVKITLVLVVILVCFFALSSLINYRHQRDFIISEAVEKARIVAFEAIRTREYISQELLAGEVPLSLERYGLIPVVVAKRVGALVARDVDYRIRQTSNRYRNVKNAPDAFESRILEQFVSDPQLQESYAVAEMEGEKVFRYLRSFVADQSCLQCHGDPDAAPEFIKKLYPPDQDQAYHYQVGEVIGAASVTIPMASLERQVAANLRNFLVSLGLIFLALVTCLGLLIRFAVTTPLTHLSEVIGGIVKTGRFEKKIPARGDDEIGRLIQGFNSMMENLQEKTTHLEESDKRFRALTETARDSIVSFLANGQIILFNRQAATLFGFSKAEALGMSVAEMIHEECREFHTVGVEGYLRTEVAGLLTEIRQISCRRRDGTLVRLELTLSEAESDGHRFYTAILREPAN